MTWIGVGTGLLLVAWTVYAVLKARRAKARALAYQREQWDEEFRKVHRGRWPPPPPVPSAPGDWHVSTTVTRTRKPRGSGAPVPRKSRDPDTLSPDDPVPWPSWAPSVGTPAPIESSPPSEPPTSVWSGGGGHSGGAGASGSWDSGGSDCGGTSSSDSGGSDSGGSDGGSCGGSSD